MRPREPARVVGLAGPAGVGKSTLARALFAVSGGSFEGAPARGCVLSFAFPVKAMLMALGVAAEDLRQQHRKVAPCDVLCGETPRRAMQTLGTAWGREMIHPDLWAHAWRRRAEGALSLNGPGFLVACDDVRYPNEAAAVRSLGGMVIQLRREGIEYAADHDSEVGPFTAFACNAGGVAERDEPDAVLDLVAAPDEFTGDATAQNVARLLEILRG